jgi:hypothetical protein
MTDTFDTDRELLQAVRTNDQDAWAQLVTRYQGRLPIAEVAGYMDINESSVRVFKHRVLKQFREKVCATFSATESCVIDPSNTLPDIWEHCRPTCPKYTTIGKFVREDLEPDWFDYIDFHLTTFGCHFCRASYRDLVEREASEQQRTLQERILHSTIGFFTQTD